MMNEKPRVPTTAQLEAELKRLRRRRRFTRSLWSTLSGLVVAASVAVIVSTMLMPVLRVTGTSMMPTLQNDEVLIGNKLAEPDRGDVIAFYYNNKILLKRVIGIPGDVINIKEDGTFLVNDELLDEPYVSEPALGETDQQFPVQVSENRYFVAGDNRGISIDSRSTSIGCIAEENVIGVVKLRVYPFDRFGLVN